MYVFGCDEGPLADTAIYRPGDLAFYRVGGRVVYVRMAGASGSFHHAASAELWCKARPLFLIDMRLAPDDFDILACYSFLWQHAIDLPSFTLRVRPTNCSLRRLLRNDEKAFAALAPLVGLMIIFERQSPDSFLVEVAAEMLRVDSTEGNDAGRWHRQGLPADSEMAQLRELLGGLAEYATLLHTPTSTLTMFTIADPSPSYSESGENLFVPEGWQVMETHFLLGFYVEILYGPRADRRDALERILQHHRQTGVRTRFPLNLLLPADMRLDIERQRNELNYMAVFLHKTGSAADRRNAEQRFAQDVDQWSRRKLETCYLSMAVFRQPYQHRTYRDLAFALLQSTELPVYCVLWVLDCLDRAFNWRLTLFERVQLIERVQASMRRIRAQRPSARD